MGRAGGVFLGGSSGVAVVLVGRVRVVPFVSQRFPFGGVPPVVVHVSALAVGDVGAWCSPVNVLSLLWRSLFLMFLPSLVSIVAMPGS
ncbi:hypothetical protein L484_005148 [Morus notabilis]|uniref:Uncharacterized protein n=1 Tax=Morus notabilis TaxID=981085 RepID=W9QMJ0_9ROSA|nr:hypothetical protein L484_005148 [Morus notabilis]